MKKLLLFFITILSLHAINAQEKSYAYTELIFHKQLKEDPTTKGDTPNTRSIPIQVAYAYIYNNVISIYFEEIPVTSTINITNESNGQTVYTEIYSSPTNLNIDMNGENSGNYQIRIETETLFLEGSFSL